MTKLIAILKAIGSFISRFWKWLLIVLFGLVVYVIISSLGRKSSLTQGEKDLLASMSKRLAEAKAKYMKQIEDARKSKTSIDTINDFDKNFGGKG